MEGTISRGPYPCPRESPMYTTLYFDHALAMLLNSSEYRLSSSGSNASFAFTPEKVSIWTLEDLTNERTVVTSLVQTKPSSTKQ